MGANLSNSASLIDDSFKDVNEISTQDYQAVDIHDPEYETKTLDSDALGKLADTNIEVNKDTEILYDQNQKKLKILLNEEIKAMANNWRNRLVPRKDEENAQDKYFCKYCKYNRRNDARKYISIGLVLGAVVCFLCKYILMLRQQTKIITNRY